MKIHRDGYGTIITVWIICIILCILSIMFINSNFLSSMCILLLVGIMGFILFFFRVPAKRGGDLISPKTVTSVADGEIVIIDKVYEPEYLKSECIQLSIFMDIFNVHVNYWPVSGEVTYYKYHPGKYLIARFPKASELNEHSSIAVRSEYAEIFFKQIAGTLARRIVCYAKPGCSVAKGTQCGLIKFGSRIDIFLPLESELKVELGDNVIAGVTVLAELPDKAEE